MEDVGSLILVLLIIYGFLTGFTLLLVISYIGHILFVN